MAADRQRFEAHIEHALGHSLAALQRARSGDCTQALHWLDVAQREVVRAADRWPRGGLPESVDASLARLETVSDEIVRRCRRGRARSHRRKRR